jgi:hypothetical protein
LRYVIVAPTETDRKSQELFEALPQKLNKRLVPVSEYDSLADAGDRFVRFIFVNPVSDSFPLPAALENILVSGLVVDTEAHTLRFLVKSSTDLIASGPLHTYVEPESLYGAVFTDKSDEYACIMERAYQRLEMVAKVYYEKLNSIAPIYDQTNCEGFYRNNPELDAIIRAAEPYPPNYGAIADAKERLKEKNTRIQLQSCPLIY